ncbi:MAG: nucleotidyltransferase family protein [Syntrophothermus sp.]
MKAMIMAAGLGTRLRPVTENIPKALVEYQGKTLLEHALMHLRRAGITNVIVNVHHFSEMVIDFIHHHDFGMDITISDESDQLLETGGGLKKAAWFFNDTEPFIVRNVDVISDLDLREIVKFHQNQNSLVTLSVRERATSRYFLFDQDGLLAGWKNISTGETKWCRKEADDVRMLAFSGLQVIDPVLFSLITEGGKFSLTDLYLRLAEKNIIRCFIEKNKIWLDIGKPENLKK